MFRLFLMTLMPVLASDTNCFCTNSSAILSIGTATYLKFMFLPLRQPANHLFMISIFSGNVGLRSYFERESLFSLPIVIWEPRNPDPTFIMLLLMVLARSLDP